MVIYPNRSREKLLGIEGGATRTVALLADGNGRTLHRLEAGPANLKFLTDAQLLRHLRSLAAALPQPDAVGVGLAGAWAETDCHRIRIAAAKVWPRVPCYATNDLEAALAAAADRRKRPLPQVLIVSGTGSGCYATGPGGQSVKIGAWGHVLGDLGSGYDIGRRALQAVAQCYDRTGTWPKLGQLILAALQLNDPNDLIGWAQTANKTEVAGLAVVVFSAWQRRDNVAAGILEEAAKCLAQAGATCAHRVFGGGRLREANKLRIQFVLAGSVLLKQPRFAWRVGRELLKLWPTARVTPLRRESVWGAVELARKAAAQSTVRAPHSTEHATAKTKRSLTVQSARLSPTEQRHPRSTNLDKMSLAQAIRLMLTEDTRVPMQVLAERRGIEQAIRAIVRSFRRGGRLFYVGAGTSGRLGVLDASECPPTFRTPPELVQGIIAGGQTALWRSVEGAEDDVAAGEGAIEFRGVTARDVVVGIAASGTTPFVWGALDEAKRRRATTVLLCFNPFLKIHRRLRPTIALAPNVGPELLTGSTRLKAGTATKLILNLFTTLAMVRLGKVMSNLMVDLNPANAKLRDRAVRMVEALADSDSAAARAALARSGWVVRKAVERLKRK